MELMEEVMEFWAPCPTDSMAITAATPITMPRMVNPLRNLLPTRMVSVPSKNSSDFHWIFLSTRPSRIEIVRWAWEAIRGSWVMMTRVVLLSLVKL